MALGTDDDVIVDGDAQRFAGGDDVTGDRDVLLARLGRAARMVVQRPSQFNMILNSQYFFASLTGQVPVIGICFL